MPASFKPRLIRAPGKLVIAGEYAVVDGGKAIAIAINRGVECKITSGFGITTPSGDTRFVSPILKDKAQKSHYAFQSWNPVTNLQGAKPGFGGSAAACVCACLAAGIVPQEAYDFHYNIQGSGSGIDIAASIYGGTVVFENREVKRSEPISPVVIWSGKSAKTGPRVDSYRRWKQRDKFIETSNQLVEEFLSNPVDVTKALFQELVQMSQLAKLDYLTPEIQRIVNLAEQYNGAAKPSGAGGGDSLVAFFPTIEDEQSFTARCKHDGITIIPIKLSKGAHFVH